MEPQNALDAAQRIVKERFPHAVAAFVNGSSLTAAIVPTSDLNILIVLNGGPAPFRETIREFGWLVELFVHTPASISYFSKLEANGHRATTQRMIATGRIVVSHEGGADRIQSAASKYLSLGPPPPSEEEMKKRRYLLTCQLEDFVDTTDPTELLYIATQMVVDVSELALLSKLHWLAKGKWLPRHLAVSDPDISSRVLDATRLAISHGEKKQLEMVVLEILDRVGGPLQEGYRVEEVALEMGTSL